MNFFSLFRILLLISFKFNKSYFILLNYSSIILLLLELSSYSISFHWAPYLHLFSSNSLHSNRICLLSPTWEIITCWLAPCLLYNNYLILFKWKKNSTIPCGHVIWWRLAECCKNFLFLKDTSIFKSSSLTQLANRQTFFGPHDVPSNAR